jgi:TMEM175 potassium channel family protein
MRGTSMRFSREQDEFGRAIAFMDATYAVALTLLVTSLDIDDRALSFKSISAMYDAVGAQFFTFLISFAVIAGYWLLHYRMVADLVAIDGRTIVANLCLIAAIVLLPFSTSSVGDPGVAHLPLPTVVMAINIAVVSLLHMLVWILAVRDGLRDHPPSARERFDAVFGGVATAAVFLASVPIAYLTSPEIARVFWLSLVVVNVAGPRVGARVRRSTNEP